MSDWSVLFVIPKPSKRPLPEALSANDLDSYFPEKYYQAGWNFLPPLPSHALGGRTSIMCLCLLSIAVEKLALLPAVPNTSS